MPDLLKCKNGVVDLRTGSLIDHDHKQRFTYCCPVDYNPKADTNAWLSFLNEVLDNNTEKIDYLQEAVGYTLTGHTKEEVLFYLYGPTRAGKGTFTETLIAMLGWSLADEVDFGTFTAKRDGNDQGFDLAGLKACRLVVASESGEYSKLNAAAIKRITGGNWIRCAFKHRNHFSYRPQFKIWLANNHSCNVDVDDNAAWGRVRVIEFPNSYLGQEDKSLKERLRRPDNLVGVLAWAVKGSISWYANNAEGLKTPSAIEETTTAARDRIDFVAHWLSECVTITDQDSDFVPIAELYNSYVGWCNSNGVTPKKIRKLSRSLKNKNIITGVQRWHNNENWKGCVGIAIHNS
jgi:putative DNA primase/helicase